MSSDVIWRIRDKLWPMPKHGSIRKVYACLAVTCHLHFWQNDRDFLRATVVTRGWNGYRNKSQHGKSTLEKKILPPFQQGFEPATFQSRVRRSNHWAIPAPWHDRLWLVAFIAPSLVLTWLTVTCGFYCLSSWRDRLWLVALPSPAAHTFVHLPWLLPWLLTQPSMTLNTSYTARSKHAGTVRTDLSDSCSLCWPRSDRNGAFKKKS